MPHELSENWELVALVLIFLLAMSVRLVPTRFGTILDPDAFFMYRMAEHIVEEGYYPTWDNLGWQPNGRSLEREMPMLSYAIAYSFILLRALGAKMTLNAWTVVFPAIAGALTIFPAYVIGRELRDRNTGLIAALLLATMPEFLSRSVGGVADKECLAFPLLLAGIALIFKVIKETDLPRSSLYGLSGGLMLGLVALTWGGYTYLLLLMTVFYGLAILMEIVGIAQMQDSTVVGLLAASASMSVVSMGIPNWHLDNPFVLIHILSSLVLLSYLLLTRVVLPRGWVTRRTALLLFVVLVIVLGTLPLYGPATGLIKFKVAQKFIILLNAFQSPATGIHTTVLEYTRPSVSNWFSSYSFYPFLALAGGILAMKRRKLEDMLLILWGGSGFYAGLSAIRSSMLLTPALCLLGAFAVRELLDILSRRRSLDLLLASRSGRTLQDLRNELRLAKLGPALAAGALILLITPSIFLGVQMVQARGLLLGQGWYDTLKWLNRETADDSIVVAWWDYGHYITAVTGKRCVSDGATTNDTTIRETARALMSPEDMAVEIFSRYDVEYVIVPEYDFWLIGAFAQVIGNITDYPEGYVNLESETGSISWSDLTPKAQNTTIFKLLFAQPDAESKNFELVHVSPGSGTTRDTTVRTYKVNHKSGTQ